jgi:hypothetical protein
MADDPRLLAGGESPFGNHRVETFNLCPRLYYYKYVDKKTVTRRATGLGTLVHQGLAHRYAHIQGRTELYAPAEAMTVLAAQTDTVDLLPEALHILKSYDAHYGEDHMQVLYVEDTFALKFGETKITMRVDTIWHSRNADKYWIVDHKTGARITSATARTYSATGQIVAARILGQKLWGRKFGGVLLNLIQTDGLKFDRQVVSPAPGLVASYPMSIQASAKRIKELEGQPCEAYPRHVSEHTCQTRYGVCSFLEKCLWNR